MVSTSLGRSRSLPVDPAWSSQIGARTFSVTMPKGYRTCAGNTCRCQIRRMSLFVDSVISSGWWFGNMNFMTFHSVGNVIIPTDELHHFSEGVGWNHQPVTVSWLSKFHRVSCCWCHRQVFSWHIWDETPSWLSHTFFKGVAQPLNGLEKKRQIPGNTNVSWENPWFPVKDFSLNQSINIH